LPGDPLHVFRKLLGPDSHDFHGKRYPLYKTAVKTKASLQRTSAFWRDQLDMNAPTTGCGCPVGNNQA